MTKNWEWPAQPKGLTLEMVKDMDCDHNPYNLKSTVKVYSETESYYCLKCFKDLGCTQEYNEFDSMGPEDY